MAPCDTGGMASYFKQGALEVFYHVLGRVASTYLTSATPVEASGLYVPHLHN